MGRNIIIAEETDTALDLAAVLRDIADQIDKGYTSGYHPTWSMTGEDEKLLDDKL